MWLYQNKTIQVGRSWTDSKGVKHPRTWSNWTDIRKKELGMVWQEPSAPPPSFDSRFFSAPGAAKPLSDTTMKDMDGNDLMDMDGSPMTQMGLRNIAIAQIKQKSGDLLTSSDWYVVRLAETGEALPADVADFRAAVRARSEELETMVGSVQTIQEMVSLYTGTEDADGKSVSSEMNTWPE
jgi:hypothetical protein